MGAFVNVGTGVAEGTDPPILPELPPPPLLLGGLTYAVKARVKNLKRFPDLESDAKPKVERPLGDMAMK